MADLPVFVLQPQIPAAPRINPIEGTALPRSVLALAFLGQARYRCADGQKQQDSFRQGMVWAFFSP